MKRKTAIAMLILAVPFVGGLPSRAWETSASNSPPQRQRNVIWRNAGDVSRLNLAWAEGGAAAAPGPATRLRRRRHGRNQSQDRSEGRARGGVGSQMGRGR